MLTTTLNVIVFYRPVALENLLNIGKNNGEGSRQYVYIAYYVGFEFVRTILREINSLKKKCDFEVKRLLLNFSSTRIFKKLKMQ